MFEALRELRVNFGASGEHSAFSAQKSGGSPFFQREKAAGLLVPGFDGSGEDVVIPAVDFEGVVGEGEGAGYFGVGL